jgi:hypothetical protein
METPSYSKVDVDHLPFTCINAAVVLTRKLNNQMFRTSR